MPGTSVEQVERAETNSRAVKERGPGIKGMKLGFTTQKMFPYQEQEEKERKRILLYVADFFAACSVIMIILVSVQAGQSKPSQKHLLSHVSAARLF